MSAPLENLRQAADAVDRQDGAAFAATYATDAVVRDPSYPEPLRGREAVRNDIERLWTAFPDLRASFDGLLGDGDLHANRWTLEGTNTGPIDFPDLVAPATEKSVRIEGAAFFSLNDAGEVVEEQRFYDVAGYAAQLGLG